MPVVADHMTRSLLTVSAGATLGDAAARMASHGVGAVVVLDGERIAAILTERDVMKAVAEKMTQADAQYYLLTGERFDGKVAARTRLVNESVPREQLKDRVTKLAKVLMEKNPHVLSTIKLAYRRVKDMNWDESEDYLYAKAQQTYSTDPEQGRKHGMGQFLDDKSYRPGLENYRRDDKK